MEEQETILSISEAAKFLNISIADIKDLENKELLKATRVNLDNSFFSVKDLEKIKSNKGPSLAQEADMLRIQDQQHVATSVSGIQKILIVAGSLVSGYTTVVILLVVLFLVNTLQTSDFFGYYYRINTKAESKAQTSRVNGKSILAAETSPYHTNSKPILANVLQQPVESALIAVSIIDNQKYQQIVDNPASSVGTTVANGTTGLPGQTGLQGPAGANGLDGTNGINGTNGTSFADVMTTIGDMVIRNGTNTTTRLGAGITGQVLTIAGGIPSWQNAAGGSSFSNLTSGTNTTGLFVIGNGASLSATGSGTITANAFSGNLPVANGGTGVATFTTNGLLFGNSSGNIQTTSAPTSGQILLGSAGGVPTFTSLSGDATITGAGVLTLKNVGAAEIYGSALNIPVFTTDAQGRITGVTNTAIAGLTTTNLSATAGITNGQLANSSLNLVGNSGSGSVSLGGTLTLTGAGITTVAASGTTLTLTSTEADTLQSVYGRGNTIITTTGRNIAFTLPSGLVTATSLTLANNGTADSFIVTDAANANIGATTRRSLVINPGMIIQNTTAATGNYNGLDIAIPALALTSGTALNVNGIKIATDGLTQTVGTLTSNGILVDSTTSTITTGGILNGIKISAPTTLPSAGTYNNLFLGTSTGSVANTQDKATIAVGNIASTAQNNFATLNITNGGTGYLDLELLHGMINMRGMNTLYDDFTNNTLDTTKWTTTVSGGGSVCAILSGGVGGIFQMTAGNGGANRACELSTKIVTALNTGYYQAGNNPIFETRVSLNSLTNDEVYAGFTDTRVPLTSTDTNPSTNHAYIAKRSTDTDWQCVTDDGTATESYVDTGVAISTGVFYRLRVEVRNGTTPETICTIDDGTTITKVTNTAHQPTKTSSMDVYLQIDVNANTTAKTMNVDYVRVWQDDPIMSGITVDNSQATPAVLAANITPTAIPTDVPVASDSATIKSQISDALSNLFANLVEFFGQVIFHADVNFLGHVQFNQDTAGHALIKSGDTEVHIIFAKEYAGLPVVTVNSNLVGQVTQDQIPTYTVFDVSTKGFTIRLSKASGMDLEFSWIALGVIGNPVLPQSSNAISPSALPTQLPTPTSTPMIIIPVVDTVTPTNTATASGSAL